MALECPRSIGSELVSAAEAFGDRLRRQRERRGIALNSVAQQTKISASLLAALERGDCSKWPGGIYSRAWIRGYATAIGMDPDDAGAEFNRCFRRHAFPNGEPPPIATAADLPRITPLRLTLDPDPRVRVRVAVRRVLFLAADLAIAGTIAALAVVLTPLTFWTVFAGVTVACHAVGLFGGGGSATGWLERRVRRHARPHDEAAGDPAVAGAA